MTGWQEIFESPALGWALLIGGIVIIAALIGVYWWDRRRRDE